MANNRITVNAHDPASIQQCLDAVKELKDQNKTPIVILHRFYVFNDNDDDPVKPLIASLDAAGCDITDRDKYFVRGYTAIEKAAETLYEHMVWIDN